MAKNRPLQDELDKSHEALPAMLMQAMVKEKLKASGVKLRKTALKRLVEQMIAGDLDTIEIDDDDLKASNKADELTTLSFGKDDMEELERRTQRFHAALDRIERVHSGAIQLIARRLRNPTFQRLAWGHDGDRS